MQQSGNFTPNFAAVLRVGAKCSPHRISPFQISRSESPRLRVASPVVLWRRARSATNALDFATPVQEPNQDDTLYDMRPGHSFNKLIALQAQEENWFHATGMLMYHPPGRGRVVPLQASVSSRLKSNVKKRLEAMAQALAQAQSSAQALAEGALNV